MSEVNGSNMLSLLGEIVSIYEKDGIQYAKIHYDPGFVDIVFQEMHDVFLNDKVLINSRLNVESVSTKVDKNSLL